MQTSEEFHLQSQPPIIIYQKEKDHDEDWQYCLSLSILYLSLPPSTQTTFSLIYHHFLVVPFLLYSFGLFFTRYFPSSRTVQVPNSSPWYQASRQHLPVRSKQVSVKSPQTAVPNCPPHNISELLTSFRQSLSFAE